MLHRKLRGRPTRPGRPQKPRTAAAKRASTFALARVAQAADSGQVCLFAVAYNQDTLPKRTRRLIKIDPVSGCWLWQGRLDKDGYGPHRAIYIKLTGHVPVGLVLDHREDFGCTSRACCNPAHLVPVTNRINTLRGQSFAAVNAAKEKCDNGHRFDFSNTYIRPNGHRDCRACIRQRVRKYQRRVRAGRRHLREQSAELARAA